MQIAVGVVLLVVLGLGGYFLIGSKSSPKPEIEESSELVVQKLEAKEIGLTLEATPDKKKIKFTIDKAQDIKSIEYELVYEADSTAQEKSEGGEATVQRGITGSADIKSGETSYTSEDLDLGSCSKNVCRYDTGVSSVAITLKITKAGNKIYEVTDSLEL